MLRWRALLFLFAHSLRSCSDQKNAAPSLISTWALRWRSVDADTEGFNKKIRKVVWLRFGTGSVFFPTFRSCKILSHITAVATKGKCCLRGPTEGTKVPKIFIIAVFVQQNQSSGKFDEVSGFITNWLTVCSRTNHQSLVYFPSLRGALSWCCRDPWIEMS